MSKSSQATAATSRKTSVKEGKEVAFLSSAAARPATATSPSPHPLPAPPTKLTSKFEPEAPKAATSSKSKLTDVGETGGTTALSTSDQVPGAFRSHPRLEEDKLPPDRAGTSRNETEGASTAGSSPVIVEGAWTWPPTAGGDGPAEDGGETVSYGQVFPSYANTRPPSRPASVLSLGSHTSSHSSASSLSGSLTGRIMRGKADFPVSLRQHPFAISFAVYLENQGPEPSIKSQIKAVQSMTLQPQQIVRVDRNRLGRFDPGFALAKEELKGLDVLVEACNYATSSLALMAGRPEPHATIDENRSLREALRHSKSEIRLRAMYSELQAQFGRAKDEIRRSVAFFLGEDRETGTALSTSLGRGGESSKTGTQSNSDDADEAVVAASLAPFAPPSPLTPTPAPPFGPADDRATNKGKGKAVQFEVDLVEDRDVALEAGEMPSGSRFDVLAPKARAAKEVHWMREPSTFESISGTGFGPSSPGRGRVSPLLKDDLFHAEYQEGVPVAMTSITDPERFIASVGAGLSRSGTSDPFQVDPNPPVRNTPYSPSWSVKALEEQGNRELRNASTSHGVASMINAAQGQLTAAPSKGNATYTNTAAFTGGGGLPPVNGGRGPPRYASGPPGGGGPPYGGGPPRGGGPPFHGGGPPSGGGGGPPFGGRGPPFGGGGGPPFGGGGPPGGYRRGPPGYGTGPSGGGPPGGGPPGGGPPPPNGQYPFQQPQDPYALPEARLEDKFKIKDLPTWDGNWDTALTYFMRVEEMASMGTAVSIGMGRYLWLQFDKGSEAESWYSALPDRFKAAMKTNHRTFCRGICASLLGPEWYSKERTKYNEMRFRQRGKADESPIAYTRRRILAARMLGMVNHDGTTPTALQEVKEVMRGYPTSWTLRLQGMQLQNLAELQQLVQTLSAELTLAYELEHGTPKSLRGRIATEDLLPLLDQLEIPYKKSSRLGLGHHAYSRRNAMLGEAIAEADETEQDHDSATEDIYAEAFAIIKRRQRPPPPEGYLFNKRDDVTTKLSRKPPSPCRACGSGNHWDRECPFNEMWLKARREKEAHALATERPSDQDDVYNHAYETIAMETAASLYVDTKAVDRRTEASEGADPDEGWKETAETNRPRETHVVERVRRDPRAATVEEVEDEESPWIPAQREESKGEVLLGAEPERDRKDSPAKVLEIPPRRRFTPGRSNEGVSVLSVKGHINALDEPLVDLRLDSGADITLLSADTYHRLKSPPRLRKGSKLNLHQLVDRSKAIEGYVHVNLYVPASGDRILKFKAEAYVVPDMAVPILLGEDFHKTYELATTRSLQDGNRIRAPGVEQWIRAEDVTPLFDRPKVVPNREAEASFVKAKSARRSRAARRKAKLLTQAAITAVRLKEDLCIPPSTVANAKATFFGPRGKEMFLEKALIKVDEQVFAAIPNCLIAGPDWTVPVANTSEKEIRLAKGTLLGEAKDPALFLDRPKDLRELERMLNQAARTAAIAEVMEAAGARPQEEEDRTSHRAEGDPRASGRPFPAEGEDDGPWGPKTAEVPDPTTYPSSRMKDIVDVGSLPAHLEQKAWEMLERRQKAFSFDGRLGHLATKVHIRTVDGLQPIAVPMYGTSPEKRLVIEEQLKKWFHQDVIEASKSPWSAPVVIAYRNGKPRFCVDYRKLNEHTVADEFPIPRQSEILAALSGAQVLSSLDALAGFTQMELDEQEKEKTAFRTHLGLFQFKRMPFGLRNGPSIFQRTMQAILAPFLWLFCLVYIDDIVVYSKSYEEHIDHLDRVLKACEDAGLTLSPAKCHLFYPSVLLLGHKVSRLGLSTHSEKVRAILELSPPRKMAQLQTFLGMAGYFSAFIPFYSMLAAPLFALLKKGVAWRWGEEEDHAFEAIKKALQEAPVLGHPQMGAPYRLYTDASDEALGCALQQVQPIRAGDLKGTKYFERLEKARREGKPVPRLVTTLPTATDDTRFVDEWAPDLTETEVHVERVVGYWSRTFKPAERNYSATEREALAAKEGLIKFQPFIEGEKVALITDHAALQWARTYENANRRLAAWGAVFSAYKPGLSICHRPGRVHSNVDPLSRLPRDRETGEIRGPPDHQSPTIDDSTPILTDQVTAAKQEKELDAKPRETFWSENCAGELLKSVFAITRARAKLAKGWKEPVNPTPKPGKKAKKEVVIAQQEPTAGTKDPYEKKKEWRAKNPPPVGHLLVHLTKDKTREFVEGYRKDVYFRSRWEEATEDADSWYPGQRFFKDKAGLLYFRDADFQPRLCVPKNLRSEVMKEFHESPFEGAHAGFDRIWAKIATIFYWKEMRKEVRSFCETCDVCQKTKPRHTSKLGLLQPNPVPSRLFETISMDLIVGLPMSNGFNAIWVAVDRLSKYALFVPTTTGLSAEGFAELFVKHLACRFGIPESIITDRDPRWTHEFWKAVSKFLKTDMWLSSSHHPQHDGQTERMNRQLEVMLRAYVREDKKDWADWLPLLEHAYNSAPAGSTGKSPFFLLYGFQPRDSITGKRYKDEVLRDPTLTRAEGFLRALESHREDARDALARAQDSQARHFNKGRKEIHLEPGDLVLVNPHSLEWLESKGEGTKMSPRFVGPFAIQERVGENTYRLDLPDAYSGNPVLNIEHLKKYKASPEEFGERARLERSLRRKESNEEYQVERIVGHRFDRRKGSVEFLVRWEGFSPLHDSWLSARELRNAPRKLFEYRERTGV